MNIVEITTTTLKLSIQLHMGSKKERPDRSQRGKAASDKTAWRIK